MGDNFISIPSLYNFGNLTFSFMNVSPLEGHYPSTVNLSSGDNNNGGNNGSLFGPWNITFFAGYNNTIQDYVNHLFNFSWANATILEPCPTRLSVATCMETAWVASDVNISWNGTQIYTNWTR